MLLRCRFAVICVAALCWFSGQIEARTASAVVSAHPLATAAGEKILANGGNAFDAAIAVGAALAVVEPYASGLGGGGFWLVHHAKTGRSVMIDGRETAPCQASSNMFLDENGQPVAGKSLDGPIAAGIPGTPAALAHLSRYGHLTLAANLAPAIELAQKGFKIDRRFAQTLQNHEMKLARYRDTAAIFLPDGKLPVEGEWFRQPQLAATLTAIARSGMKGFYQGAVARELVRSVRAAGGLWHEQDLENYHIVKRKPVQFRYRNAQITSVSLPSAGGLTLAQALNILETILNGKQDEVQKVHLIVEALRLAYKDRAELLGDSDFVTVPADRLLSKAYAHRQAAIINPNKAGVSQAKTPSPPAQHLPTEGTQTTHFAVLDKTGNRVAATLTINTFFGSGFVAGSTGVLLNNEMDDFSMGEHIPNVFGLQGSRANAIAPGKRPLSSMSPTFVDTDKGFLIAGTPGGSRIISMLLLVILDFIDNANANPQTLAARPRFHHQYLPDVLQIEPDVFNAQWINALQSLGHEVQTTPRPWGNMQLIHFDKQSQTATTANDPRSLFDTRY